MERRYDPKFIGYRGQAIIWQKSGTDFPHIYEKKMWGFRINEASQTIEDSDDSKPQWL